MTTMTSLRTLTLVALTLALSAVEVHAQRGGAFRGGGGSVRYGGSGVRGDTNRRTYNRSNPEVSTRANAGSIRAGRTPGAARPDTDGYPLEPGGEPPRPGRTGVPAGTAVRSTRPVTPPGTSGRLPLGATVAELPEGSTEVIAGGKKYSYHLGLFYRPRFSYGAVEYERVAGPRGAVLEESPMGAREVTVGTVIYREYADTWYKAVRRRNRDQWMIVAAPVLPD